MAAIDRLSALDAAFLDLETPRAPLHVGWTLRFAGRPPTPAALRRHLEVRLDRVPRFRRRLAELPGGIAWVDDPAFDIARHVGAVWSPAPGDAPALRDTAGALLSRPLDRDRPLWDLHLVSGLAGGGFAIVGRAHHALVDGVAAVEVAMLLFGDDPDAPPASTWRARTPPTPARAAGEAVGARAVAAGRAATALSRAARRPGALRAVGALAQLATPAAQTTLDRTSGAARVVGFADAPLEDVRAAGHRRGATVNDVLLSAASVALGAALARRGDHPRAFRALVPVNVRADGAAGSLGNAVSFTAVDLPVGEADPVAVLRIVRDRTRAAKANGAARSVGGLVRAGDLLPAAGRRAAARTAARVASYNVVVSNVAGPAEPLTVLGRRLRSMHPAVPLLDGHGLTICALSYAGRLHVGIQADAGVLPDVVEVARDMERAFDALRLAPARAAPRGPTPWRARAAARRAAGGRP